MARFFLSAYSMRVKHTRSNTYRALGNFDRRGADLFEVLGEYLTRRIAIASDADPDTGKMLQVTKKRRSKRKRILKGLIDAGDYGFTARLYDTELGQDSYDRNVDEAELLPYYFLVHLPKSADQGFLILQRIGQRGIRSLLYADFAQEFLSLFPAYGLELRPIVPDQLITNHLSRGRITRIRYLKSSLPSDRADYLRSGGSYAHEIGTTEVIHKVMRGRSFTLPEPIAQYIRRERNLNSLLELQEIDCDNIKLVVELNGNSRTIDLSHLDRFRANYETGEEVEIGPNGHPLFESMDGFALSLLSDLSPKPPSR